MPLNELSHDGVFFTRFDDRAGAFVTDEIGKQHVRVIYFSGLPNLKLKEFYPSRKVFVCNKLATKFSIK